MRSIVLAFCVLCATAVTAAARDAAALYDAMRLDDLIAVMREEGLAQGETMGQNMLGGGGAAWRATVDRIYDLDRMETAVRTRFEAALDDADTGPVHAFFTSDTGQEVIALEISAREALMNEAVEEAARARYRETVADGGSERFDMLVRFAEINDLIELNVAGSLNSSLQFYTGLADGGAISMTEGDIVAEVWGSEGETRADTTEWVMGYMMLAYRPLPDADLRRYMAVSDTPSGAALNAALFEAFNAMFDAISYDLGFAVARAMQAQEL